ncbi:hypothetical protein A9K71_18165 [Mesorhizobium sp. WSM3873]|nr:hypothetical protein A9K71_18165 [Mesorhizobium sp. WSM3873]
MRRAMKAEIGELMPAAGRGSGGNWGGVGRHAPDTEAAQQSIRPRLEPTGVTRFADQAAVGLVVQQGEELFGYLPVELQTGRQLDQEGGQPFTETSDLTHESIQKIMAIYQAALMGRGFGDFDREPKTIRDRARPALIGFALMRFVEGGVDLHDRKTRSVTLQLRARRRNRGPVRCRYGPSGCSDKIFAFGHVDNLDRRACRSRRGSGGEAAAQMCL